MTLGVDRAPSEVVEVTHACRDVPARATIRISLTDDQILILRVYMCPSAMQLSRSSLSSYPELA